jgi:Lipocalin-like domain
MSTLAGPALVGTWKLRSWTCTWSDGTVTLPYGASPKGYFLFNVDGYSSVVLIPGEPTEPSPTDPVRALFGPSLAYSGRYEIETDRVVIHCEVSSFPQWVGSDQIRFFKFTDGGVTLTLSPPPSKAQGKEFASALVWQRVRT